MPMGIEGGHVIWSQHFSIHDLGALVHSQFAWVFQVAVQG